MFDQGHILFLILMLAAEQVSEEVERALAKLGPAKLNNTGRYFFCSLLLKKMFISDECTSHLILLLLCC